MEHPSRWSRIRQLAGILLSAAACATAQAAEAPREIRALWVTRWDYKTPGDVRAIVRNCERHHFNVVLFQVRGNGTVFYDSEIEPWAWELTGTHTSNTGADPGWDPLKLACYEARKRGIDLHAYINVLPGWRGLDFPPPSAGQLWTAHPDWFMVDPAGGRMTPRSNWYSFLSPGIPEVQQYLEEVFLEVIRKYRIQGIHFDYIRYPSEVGDFSYDSVSLERFQQATGNTPERAPAEWAEWRAEQVTRIEQNIYLKGKKLRSDLVFSAAVIGDPEMARGPYFQDAQRWMREGTLDVLMPMVYTSNLGEFRRRARAGVALRENRWAAVGIGVDQARNNLIQQIGIAEDMNADGVALFSYGSLFPGHRPSPQAEELLSGPFREKANLPWN